MARKFSSSTSVQVARTLTSPPSCSNWKPLPLPDGEPLAAGDSPPALADADSTGVDAAGAAEDPVLPPPQAATISTAAAARAARRVTECRASSFIQCSFLHRAGRPETSSAGEGNPPPSTARPGARRDVCRVPHLPGALQLLAGGCRRRAGDELGRKQRPRR